MCDVKNRLRDHLFFYPQDGNRKFPKICTKLSMVVRDGPLKPLLCLAMCGLAPSCGVTTSQHLYSVDRWPAAGTDPPPSSS